MSTDVVVVPPNTPPEAGGINATEKPERTLLQILKEKFGECKDFILDPKNRRGLANIGQIGGTATLVAGGAALLFSGIAANLTIAGIPLGIPLMIAGGILFISGTALQIAYHAEQTNLTAGEKVKGVLKESLANVTIGTLLGGVAAGACSVTSLTNLIAIIGVAIKLKPLLKMDINDPEALKVVKGVFKSKNKDDKNGEGGNGTIADILENAKSMDDVVEKLAQKLGDKAGKAVMKADRSMAEFLVNILTKPSEQDAQPNPEGDSQGLALLVTS